MGGEKHGARVLSIRLRHVLHVAPFFWMLDPDMAPASHVWSTTLQVFALATLAEIENVLSEEPMAICCLKCGSSPATCTYNSPSVSGIRAFIPELYTSMTTTLKHFQFHKMPPSTEILCGIATTPTVQAVVVDGVPIVDPQLAAII